MYSIRLPDRTTTKKLVFFLFPLAMRILYCPKSVFVLVPHKAILPWGDIHVHFNYREIVFLSHKQDKFLYIMRGCFNKIWRCSFNQSCICASEGAWDRLNLSLTKVSSGDNTLHLWWAARRKFSYSSSVICK